MKISQCFYRVFLQAYWGNWLVGSVCQSGDLVLTKTILPSAVFLLKPYTETSEMLFPSKKEGIGKIEWAVDKLLDEFLRECYFQFVKEDFFFFTEVLILRTLFGNWLWDHVCNFLSEQKGLYMFDSQVMKAMYLKGTAVFRLLIVHNLSASKKMGSGVAHEKICARDPHAYHSIKPVAFGKRRR